MRKSVRFGVVFGGAVCVLAAPAGAQDIPPDTVSTIYVSDTIPGYGAVGGISVDLLGFVYVADFRNSVWRLSPEGEVSLYADGLYGASGNAIGPEGELYQSNFHGQSISRISRTGEVTIWADTGLSGPVGIAATSEGVLYVLNCRGGSVSRVARDRTVTEFARSDLMACPNGITIDDQGELYTVNFNNTKVLKISKDGEVSELADIPGAGGNGHIAFARGTLFVTKFRGNQVFRLTRKGTFSVLAGTGAAGREDGAGPQATFTRPNGIAAGASGTELWVNDLTERVGLGRGRNVVSLRRIRLVTLIDVLSGVDSASGGEGVRDAYRAYHAERPSEALTPDVITVGYQWLQTSRAADGIALFEVNAEAFPEDATAQFHCGEVYRFTGQPEKAAGKYREVLRLQPDHPTAAARLAEVGG